MRRVILFVMGILLTLPGFTQTNTPFYYNDYWKLTTREEAVYFRTGALDTTHLVFAGAVKDYFRKGQLQMSGSYQAGLRHGPFVFYYANGQIERKGNYELGQRVGEWHYYYPSGSLKQRVEFANSDFHVWEYYDSLGNIHVENGTGVWQNRYKEAGSSGEIIIEGSFADGKKDGKWKCFNKYGRLYYVETFKEGEFVKGRTTNTAGNRVGKYDQGIDNKLLPPYKLLITERFVFASEDVPKEYPHLAKLTKIEVSEELGSATVDEQPMYPGGIHQAYRFVASHLTYPERARREEIQGKVFVQFVIDKDGSVTQVKTIKGIGGGCDREAERIVSLMKNWEPGYKDGEPVQVRMVLPITFRLTPSLEPIY